MKGGLNKFNGIFANSFVRLFSGTAALRGKY